MAPSSTAVGGVLRQAIHYHLDNASHESALFFAERLTAQDPRSNDAAHLYALCHLRLGDLRSAYDASKTLRGVHLGCSWVFAQACLALERYKEGITALEKSRGLWSGRNSMGKHSATSRSGCPDAPAVLCMLGRLHRGHDDKKKAISCFEEALKLNPFMWEAFTSLCDMGVNVRVSNIFRPNEAVLEALESQTGGLGATEPREPANMSTNETIPKKNSLRTGAVDSNQDPFSISFGSDISANTLDMASNAGENDFMSKIQAARARNAAASNSQSPLDGADTPTNHPSADAVASRNAHSQEPPQAPLRRNRILQSADTGAEAPPRMNYKIGARRGIRPPDRQGPEHMDFLSETGNTSAATIRPSVTAVERKRTVSGHPVTRPTNAEEQATRRSARLNMFKPSSKVNAGAATIGAAAGRELKKARPQISRIVRPGSSGPSVGRVVSGNRKPLEDYQGDVDQGETSRTREPSSTATVQRPTELDPAKLEEALKWTLDLLRKLGNGYFFLSKFQCQEALQAFGSLSPSHQNSPWVLAQMGRAHYEQASYADAEKVFRKMRVQAPSRLEDMEVYSTVLWHLKRETDLSFLAHELVDAAWQSPQAWCALGNAWSLARDPEQALRCFKRATQLNPKFAYAFTLQGHEHVANEEYEKALTAYRQAISADRRHYNAYYGIGRVQERLGAYDKAYSHFSSASAINPNNAVLICCIGTMLEKQKQLMPALQAYTKAAELAPHAAQTRYKKAKALLALGQIDAARKEFTILLELAPEEGSVHFLLGTLYRSMNEKQRAVYHYTVALALDPKAGPKIKEAIESIEGEIPLDDSMMT